MLHLQEKNRDFFLVFEHVISLASTSNVIAKEREIYKNETNSKNNKKLSVTFAKRTSLSRQVSLYII